MKTRFFISLFLVLLITQSCTQNKSTITKETKETALSLAQDSQKSLGMHLMKEVKNNGLVHAISFCNDTAELLIQRGEHTWNTKLDRILHCKIKRVSDRNRNLNNAANQKELAYISESKKRLSEGKTIKPAYSISDSIVTAYIPIMTKPICLNCHGEAANMDSNVVAKLMELYPDDKAVNYKDKDLRGIWVIKMHNLVPE